MTKRIAALTLSAALLLLSACGGKTEARENPYRLIKSELVYHAYESFGNDSSYTYEYDYTEDGWLAQTDSYTDGCWASTEKYFHDEYGNIYAATTTKADGTSSYGESRLTLDEHHRPVLVESFDSEGNLFGTKETTYDKDGNILQQITKRIGALDEGQDWTDWVDWQYDTDGKPIRQDIRWSTGSASYVLYEYQNGRLVKQTTYAGNGADTVTAYTEYSYDETGLVQTQQNYDKNGQPENKYIITCDEYGNELIMESYRTAKDGSSSEILVRVVTNTYELIPE